MRVRPVVLLGAIGLVAAACGDGDPALARRSSIPDKTVVFTFDDALRSHLDVVAPLLEEHGFGATFFVTRYLEYSQDAKHRGAHLAWREMAELHRRGFEIGNHTFHHKAFHLPKRRAYIEKEIRLVEDALSRVGVPKPVSFGWPVSAFGPEAWKVLGEMGYRWGRRGMEPEVDGRRTVVGATYDPLRHDPLLIPSTAIAGPGWTWNGVDRILAEAEGGRAVVIMFHGIPDPTNPRMSMDPDSFRELLRRLKDGGYQVIALRDLRKWVSPTDRPDDPLTRVRSP